MRTTTILGLDYGERRIGVALSDTSKTLATGLMTIDCRAQPDFLEVIARVIRDEQVEAIVVGYPVRTDAADIAAPPPPGSKAAAVDVFIAELERRFGLPVHREDESYTSQLAQASLRNRPGARKGRAKRGRQRARDKADIDRVAACYILQDHLDNLGSTR